MSSSSVFFIPIIVNVGLYSLQLSVQFLDAPAGVTHEDSHTLLLSWSFVSPPPFVLGGTVAVCLPPSMVVL